MESNLSFIDINKAFSCFHCKKLAYKPFVSQCCQVIVCQECVKNGIYCPKCKQYLKGFKQSPLLLSIYQSVIMKCPFGCKKQLGLSQVQKHSEVCPEATIQCIYCKEMHKIGNIPEHIGEKHIEECNRLLIEFQKDPNLNNINKVQGRHKTTIQPFKVGTTGTPNMDPRLSSVGRIICGRALSKNNPMSQSTGLFGKNQQELCSIEGGSCDRCMQLDVKRLGLPKRHILNNNGKICCASALTKKVFCGISGGAKRCSNQIQCQYCKKTMELIQKGLYSTLIQ